MTTCLARERQNIFVEMKGMEKHMLSPIDTEGVVGVLAWSACDHEDRRRLVAVKREKTTLVAIVKQKALMRARQEVSQQELHEVIKSMSEREGKFRMHFGKRHTGKSGTWMQGSLERKLN